MNNSQLLVVDENLTDDTTAVSSQASSMFKSLEENEAATKIVSLTAKSYAFAGAVLSPKHAQDLTPSLCLAIASALSEHSRKTVPYTSWITEAWRVLGWAEPSAALFWELATMYHTLFMASRALDEYQTIPAILSVGSASSLGSAQTHGTDSRTKKQFATASAKELPVWLVSTFLLLHCEEVVQKRNLAAQDDRRFFEGVDGIEVAHSSFPHPSLSPRTRIHAGWSDSDHCTAYLLRHLRKFLLLIAIPSNAEAVNACMHLAALPTTMSISYSIHELRRLHDEEHGQIGLNVSLTLDELERLHLLIHQPHGGGIDDAPLKIGDNLWTTLRNSSPAPMARIPLGEVEKELRRKLEQELGRSEMERETRKTEEVEKSMAKLRIQEDPGTVAQPIKLLKKELSYEYLRSTTILLRPSSNEVSSGASANSIEQVTASNFYTPQRLHDLKISDSSDTHFYLLQPFEHVTIVGCINCTIVVGAVAGLLYVVDCEKVTITACSRRVLVSNSSDVKVYTFTPSAPLLVGDNRNCQFAPYNTYYDGLRDDLLVTGLAAAVLPEAQSPYQSGRPPDHDGTWPPLQCASNKWKHATEISKLESPTAPVAQQPSMSPNHSPGADDRAMGVSGSGADATAHTPILLPASDFNIIFVPIENENHRLHKSREIDEGEAPEDRALKESPYCRHVAEILQLSPFRLPVEYEKRVSHKAERVKNIQQAQKALTAEQQKHMEEKLHRDFRDWLVSSGNLRQILDLVRLEKPNGS